MALREIDKNGGVHDAHGLDYQHEFDQVWLSIPLPERTAIEDEINHRLDQLIASPDPNWGSITNTSIEGGKPNPQTGIKGDWSGTVFDAIFVACGQSEERAGMFYGTVWKKVIISRAEKWIGIRSEQTFPNRGITLQGKTYFLDNGN